VAESVGARMRQQAGSYVVWGGRNAHGTIGPLRAWPIGLQVAFIVAPFIDGTCPAYDTGDR